MGLTAGLHWTLDGVDIDGRLVALLSAIAARGSLQQAIGDIGLSYRHAWELLGRLESALGQPLVQLQRGRGARLTPFGTHLTKTTRAVEIRLQPELKRAAAELSRPLKREDRSIKAIAVCASHDLALGKLVEMLIARGGPPIELHFQGSLDALVSLARNQCDVAGFHVPELPGRHTLVEPYRPWLKARSLRLIHFADRRQGLIVARRNPLHISGLADLVRTRARFVNRQAGSGTRFFLDALLAAHRIRSSQINGYRTEEFTHAAIAAMIASGVADAGFGIEAAAAQHRLAFVPLASERYFLVARSTTLSRPGLQALIETLKSRWFRNAMRKLPGYTLPQQVEPLTVKEAFQTRPA